MVTVQEELSVNQTAVEVWGVLAEFDGISRWAPNVDHSCLTTERDEGVGAQRRIQTGRAVVLEEIVTWAPEHQLGYTIEGLPPVVRSVTNTWTLDEVDGATTVTLTSEVDAGSKPPQQLVARGVGRALAKASKQMLGGLKDYLEGNAA